MGKRQVPLEFSFLWLKWAILDIPDKQTPSLPVSSGVCSFQEEKAREADLSPTCGTGVSVGGTVNISPVCSLFIPLLPETAADTCQEEGFSLGNEQTPI